MSDPSIEQRLRALESSLAEMQDRETIRQLLNRYARALDWLDEALLETVFFDDAEIDYGFFRGNAKEFRTVVMDIERNLGRRWHFSAQEKIHLRGDIADVESYSISIGSEHECGVEGSAYSQFVGLYRDRIERRDGVWRIAARKYIVLATATVPEATLDGPLGQLNVIGKASPSNPLFDRLGDVVAETDASVG